MADAFTERLATVRRYLSIAMREDLNALRMQELLGWGGGTWGRWENGEMRPRRDKIEAICALAARYGLTWITPAWLDYGSGEGPPSVITGPVAVPPKLPTKPKAVRGEKLVRPEDEAAKRRKKNPRRA